MATIFSASGMRTEVGKRRREKGRDVPAAVDMQREVKVQDNELFAEVLTKKTLSGFAKFDKTYPKSSPGAAWYDVLQSKTGIGQFHPDDSANPGHVHVHVERLHGWKTVRVWLISGCGEVLAVSPSSRRQEVKRRYEKKCHACVKVDFPLHSLGIIC